MKKIKPFMLSGQEVLPIIEGGKGVAITNGRSSGAFAAAGAIGTFSGVNADLIDDNGEYVPLIYKGKTRKERHEELIAYSIKGGISQARIAHKTSQGKGRIHMNILWEMGGAQRVLQGVLEGAKGLIHGITCGAGMPYKLGEIAAKYQVYYYPIISSMRAFRALWKRAYSKFSGFLGGVVYEDPWLAGGHNGLSNKEDPDFPGDPFPRVADLRAFMNEVNLSYVPVVMAGGVWYLRDWHNWLDSPEIGPVAFQFGTRPLLTQESPIPMEWKQKLLTLKEGDISLNKFSPTGFYSSAVNNEFLQELQARSSRQVPYLLQPEDKFNSVLQIGPRMRTVYIRAPDLERVAQWQRLGYTEAMRTPESTLIFVTPADARQIHADQVGCMGCLSHCAFSNWKDHDDYTTSLKTDPRSFCIQKTLQNIAHGRGGGIERELMFAGHNAYKFAEDPFYKGGFIPYVKQLVERILTGD
ncbi:2-nitropropane dioxygenase [Rickettsiales bacterium]|nr:2-nitropropane dioxygenase [Rickettsiales bacterium]